jgi:hypothetical protein
MHDEELDARLRSADRMNGIAIPDDVLDRVFAEARAEGRRGGRVRTGVIGAGVVLGLIGGAVAAPAIADTVRAWLAVSEWQPEAGGEVLPGSEMVDLSAADLPEYIASRYPEWLPLAPGETREHLIDEVVARWSMGSGNTQEVGLRHDFEMLAYCGWVDAWLNSADPSEVAQATTVFRQAIDWPAMNETDGGGTREFLTVYAMAAEAGDRDGIQFAAWQYGCDAWDGQSRAWWLEQNEWFQQNDPRR